jgi:hypothetical protein
MISIKVPPFSCAPGDKKLKLIAKNDNCDGDLKVLEKSTKFVVVLAGPGKCPICPDEGGLQCPRDPGAR